MTKLRSDRPEFEGLNQLYDTEMAKPLESLETARRRRVAKGLTFAVISTPFFAFVAWRIYMSSSDGDSDILNIIWLGPISVYMLLVWKLRRQIKTFIVSKLSAHLKWTHTPARTKSLVPDLLYTYDLLPKFNNKHIDDILEGTHLGWPFRFKELTLTKREGFGDSRRDVIVFQGAVLSFDVAGASGATSLISRQPINLERNLTKRIPINGEYGDILGTVYI